MVQIVPASSQPTVGERFSSAIGAGLEKANKFQQLANENKYIKENLGIDLAGIENPQLRQQLITDQLTYGRKLKQAQAGSKVDYSGTGSKIDYSGERQAEERGQFPQETTPQRGELPVFETGRRQQEAGLERRPQEARTERRPQEAGAERRTQERLPQRAEGPGNFPQPGTGGVKQREMNANQLAAEGQRIAQERTAQNIPTSFEEGLQIASVLNEDRKAYNASVDADIQARQKAQTAYGGRAIERLLKVMPDASDEIQTLFQKKGEEESQKEGMTEATFDKAMAKEVKDFKNTLHNVGESVGPPRLWNTISQALLGTERSAEKSRQDIRIKLKPLLDLGLYDTARNLLADLGYHPEEREVILSDLGEGSKKVLSQFSPVKQKLKPIEFGKAPKQAEFVYSEQDEKRIQESIRNAVLAEPSVNFILLRKGFEDKGVDWQKFKDNLNDLIESGEIKINEEQRKQLPLLEQPRLNNLDKIMYSFGLTGP